ncbi:MAG: GNAT family N-acetyltransferase [Rickettsiales bacterium]
MGIKRLTAEQAPALAHLHAGSMEKSWDEKSFVNFLNEKTIVGIGAFDSEILLGFFLYRVVEDEMEILTIAVDEPYRRQGIARQLLKEGMPENATVFLEVNEENSAAQALYLNAGFEIYGQREKYYQTENGMKDAILMRKKPM